MFQENWSAQYDYTEWDNNGEILYILFSERVSDKGYSEYMYFDLSQQKSCGMVNQLK